VTTGNPNPTGRATEKDLRDGKYWTCAYCRETNVLANTHCFMCTRPKTKVMSSLEDAIAEVRAVREADERAEALPKCLNCNEPIRGDERDVPAGYCSVSCCHRDTHRLALEKVGVHVAPRGKAEPTDRLHLFEDTLRGILVLTASGEHEGLPEAYYRGVLLAIRSIVQAAVTK
jgi:hypothetical protein